MTEEKGVGINADTLKVISQGLLDYYNFMLTGKGFEELVTRMVVLKETGWIGSSIQFTDILVALTMFHATAVIDIENKSELPPAAIDDMRLRTVNAFAASLTYRDADVME